MESVQDKLVKLNGEQVKLVIWQDGVREVVVHNGRLVELVDGECGDFTVDDEKNAHMEDFWCREVYKVVENLILVDRESEV